MKIVLFCGGLGTRIRDYSENVPKPMIPIGGKPILWHLMSYYSQFGHKDFMLCLGYKANVIKEFFLNYQPHIYADCVVSSVGTNVEPLGDPQQDWRISLIDTGVWRNIGERLYAVRQHVQDEEMFLADYSDGLSDVDLRAMIDMFKESGKVACFLATRPTFCSRLSDGWTAPRRVRRAALSANSPCPAPDGRRHSCARLEAQAPLSPSSAAASCRMGLS
jgi:glucose-1-phosphate cytidylyltransferase